MSIVQNELGYNKMVSYENHVGDAYATAETEALADFYGVNGIPDVRIGGKIAVIGAGGGCTAMANNYRPKILDLLAETDGLSPIAIMSDWSIAGNTATLTATYTLVDPVELTDLRATLLLYEDDVAGGAWDHVTRKIYHQNVAFTEQGDDVLVQTTFPITGFVAGNLHAVAYIQQTSGSKEVLQAQAIGLGAPPDYSTYYERKVRSVPDGNGTAIFDGQLWNLLPTDQTFTLAPGTAFGDWTTDFLVCGDPNPHTTPIQVILAPDQICNFRVRVHTNSTLAARTGSFQITSSESGRIQTNNLKVFNGSPAVYLINDNSNTSHYLVFTQALDALGYLYERWDINYQHGGAAPSWGNVFGYDIMIWENALRASNLPNAAEQALMMRFMDAGGSLFFTSQAFLNSLNNVPNTFTQSYLGISSWIVDRSYLNLADVAGDPIGNGLTLPLTFDFPSLNKGDHVVPNTAITGLIGDVTSNALVHNILRGSKCVFMPSCFNAVSASDPDPNNQRVLLGRVLDWLTPEPAADAPEGSFAHVSRIEGIRPNPFNPRTEIAIQLTSRAAAGSARLEIIDPSGRRVASLFEGALPAGTHRFTWDGNSASGKPADSGVYFVCLRTMEGERSQKLVLLK